MSRGPGLESLGSSNREKIHAIATSIEKSFLEKNLHPLDNPEIYEFIAHMSTEDRKNLFEKLGSITSEKVRDVALSLGEAFTACLFHPGVSVRAPAFIEFARNEQKENPDMTPFQAIEKFSDFLGEKTLYRGLLLSVDEEPVPAKIVLAPAMQANTVAVSTLESLLDPARDQYEPSNTYVVSFAHDASSKTTDLFSVDSDKFVSISSSQYKEVAASISWHHAFAKEKTEGRKLYVIAIRVPILHTYSEEQLLRDTRVAQKVRIGDVKYTEGIEILIPFGVTPDRIESIEEIHEPPLLWEKVVQ